jgi:hypothetical protein
MTQDLRPLYRASDQLVLGFHGTTRAVSDSVLNGESDLQWSTGTSGWVGPGIYFWEWDYEHALQWAKDMVERQNRRDMPLGKPAVAPGVIGVILRLGECLDLTQLGNLKREEISEAYCDLLRTRDLLSKPMPVNQDIRGVTDSVVPKRFLDSAVVASVHLARENTEQPRPFDSIRSAFQEGARLFEGSELRLKTHVQICVLNHNCILGYFRPRARKDPSIGRFSTEQWIEFIAKTCDESSR